MAALVEQKEAARLLGISEDELNAMISRNEIFGYRDGPNWKFKMQELERVADERGIQLGTDAPEPGGSGIDADLEQLSPVDDEVIGEDEAESILVSEEELGQSGVGTASTIIGREKSDPAQSDVKLADDQGDADGTETEDAGASDILLSSAGDDLLGDSKSGSGTAQAEEQSVAGDSDVTGEGEENSGDTGSETGIGLDDDVLDVELEVGSAASATESSDEMEISDSLSIDDDELDSADSLSLDEDDAADSLALDDDWDDESPTQLGVGAGGESNLAGDDDDDDEDDLVLASSVMLGSGEDEDDEASALALGEDEDVEIGSGKGSDVTLGSGDSGIGLANPTDSGLSLEEEPVDLGGSQVGAMALGEDDMIELEEEGDPDAATQLKADDDFLLTPVDDDADEESDSGSQVIALDTEQFDEEADTMLAAGPAVLEEDDFGEAPAPAGLAPGPGMAGQPMMHPAAQLPEAKYSIWNVLSLMLVFALVALTGMLMVDVVQNMWQYDQPLSASGTVMEFVLSIMPE